MNIWYRIFGTKDLQPGPAVVIEQFRSLGIEAEGRFYGDDQGWFQVELRSARDIPFLAIERFLAEEEGIRAQLNTWAAWLETAEENPNHGWLMQHVISTCQLFTLHELSEEFERPVIEKLCLTFCRFLARETAGVYQVDEQGFFAAEGTLLVEERLP